MTDFFQLLNLPEAYHLDPGALRQSFLAAARQAHPDHRTGSEEANDQTAELNAAYRTLADPHTRLQYLLQRYGLLDDAGGSSESLPPDFLLEMMELNDEAEALRLSPNTEGQAALLEAAGQLEASIRAELESLMTRFDRAPPAHRAEALRPVQGIYLRQRYVLRLLDGLRSFED